MGIDVNDERLLRPSDEPSKAEIVFDWDESVDHAMFRRVELRRQKWSIRQRELELIAARNQLLARLDLVGQYRWRGFGDDLLHSDSTGRPRFDNAYADLTSGDFQEWQLGVELSVPLGFRQAAAAVRNAEIMLTRSRAVLREQEHLVLHDAASSVAEFDRAVVVAQTTARRLDAARTQSAAVEAAYDADKAPLDLMLEAQRRLADADSRYYQSLAEYAIAVKNVHFAKGTLLDYDGVALSESAWPAKAYVDAAERNALRSRPRPLNYISARAPIVSAGPYDQRPLSGQPPTDAVAPSPAEGAAPGEAIQPQQPPPLVLPTPVAQIAPTGMIEPVAYTPPAEGAPSGAGP
jgi:hypothetical protein